MNPSFPLKPLLDLTQTRMDDAARRLGQLIASEQEGTRKLELLQNYRAEYETRFHDAARNGLSPEAWRNYAGFLGRIDEAVAVQAAAVERSRRLTVAGQETWTEQRNKVKAFDTLQKRFEAGEARKAAKQEQRASDEYAAKRYRDRVEADDTGAA